ncbi:MAG: response regulator transcription factor [Bacteroidetes bacterium]|nr:response regulator transcription factor [Bacteroidota bacterium]
MYIDSNHQRYCCVKKQLQAEGLDLERVADMQKAYQALRLKRFRLIVIECDTVKTDITKLCSFIKDSNPTAVIICIMKTLKFELEGTLFDIGVNDVVIGKQASAGILIKRIKAHLLNAKSDWPVSEKIKLKNTVVDFNRGEVWCNGELKKLPGILGDLLKYFLNNPEKTISRKELRHSHMWADSICSPPDEGGRTFDVSIGKLRKIIEADSTKPQIIKSVRGVGWKLAEGIGY